MAERETLEVDVLIVGGGPAGMSAALRLAQIQKEKGGEPLAIAVLEKARETGAHMLSGAVLDPSTLKDLIPDFKEKGAPLATEVHGDDIYYLTRTAKVRLPITPPFFQNHGNYLISLSRFVKWLGGLVEAEGIDVFTGFPATEVLFDGDRVVGVRTGDRGMDKHGQKKSTFEPGVDIRAKVTVFTDGVRGNLTKSLVRQLGLDDGKSPQVYAIGIKELWEVPAGRIQPGRVAHTMGFPLKNEEFGGGFVYSLPDNLVSLGLVTGLDYKDPMFDPHIAFQHFKRHPLIASMLEGATLVRYGAKALPEGGWYTVPKLYAAGALIAGDAAGLMNSARLKGIHLAMRSGMLAAETCFEAIRKDDTSAAALKSYDDRVQASAIRKELYPVRNVHQAFGYGSFVGAMFTGLSLFTGGWWFRDPLPAHGGWTRMKKFAEYYKDARPDSETPVNPVKIDRQLTFDRLTGVHYSGTRHPEDQPSHLIVHDASVCATRCGEEFGNPCIRFCPANVYEMVDDGAGKKKLQINASNCVHCKTCDIMDPYQIIDWVPPEGGGGPQYKKACNLASDQRLTPGQLRKAALISATAAPLIRALGATYRWRVDGLHHYDAIVAAGQQPILAFWHGRILPATLYFRNRGIVVMISQNFDGEWITRVINRFGYDTARGSTSRGGARALVQLRRDLTAGKPVGFALDGPRGPARVAQAGAVFLAGATGYPILPFHLESSAAWTMKSWDRTQIPRPFATVALAVGEPLHVPDTAETTIADRRLRLEQQLASLERHTLVILNRNTGDKES